MKKKVHKLRGFSPEDFQIIGIASHQNDYRLSWAMNQQLNLKLQKETDLEVKSKRNDEVCQYYTRYAYTDTNRGICYHLIANKNSQGFLLPEMKNLDFLLKVEGQMDEQAISDLVREIKRISFIIIAFRIENLRENQRKKFIF
jgi:hypothetical protein